MLVKSRITCKCANCHELITTGDYKFSYGKKAFCFKCGFGKKKALLNEIPYRQKFYLNGVRYRQLVRLRTSKPEFMILCCEDKYPWVSVDISSKTAIKPVVRVNHDS